MRGMRGWADGSLVEAWRVVRKGKPMSGWLTADLEKYAVR